MRPGLLFVATSIARAASMTTSGAVRRGAPMRLLTQQEAVAIDDALMATPGFSIDQLMELAGLSVACALAAAYPARTHRRVLCVCGPGNTGGDGLVAARHLWQFGYEPTVVYPKRPQRPLFINLCEQMRMMEIPVLEALPDELERKYDLILDAIFGFSFTGAPRAPFDTILPAMQMSHLPLISVDIPSGWHIEKGPQGRSDALMPQVLISLTAPKLCAAHFKPGRHFLGGRFVPPTVSRRFNFGQPRFEGTEQVIELFGSGENWSAEHP